MTESAGGSRTPGAALSPSERRQRGVAIGLGITGGFVLLIGVIAFAATRGDDGGAAGSIPATDTVPASTVIETTTIATSTTSTSTTTTTGAPIPAVADAGVDLDADRGAEVALLAGGLS